MGWLIGAAAVVAPAAAAAGAVDLFYERTVMMAADARCGLFEPGVGAALAAGQAQARGAALRGGLAEQTLVDVERRARAKAAGDACDSPDLTLAADRVKSAFEGFAKVTRMDYPGEIADWRADRGSGRFARWRLAQTVAFGWDKMTFGLAGFEGADALMAVGQFADGQTPYAARLVIRDTRRTSGPYLDTRETDPRRRPALARRLPPEGLRTYPAEARSAAGADLLPKGASHGWAFRFPAEAAAAMAALDPREAVAVEFVFAGDRDEVRRAYVEVGDFAAGRAFLRIAR
ncbi:MAG: hypothetical protein ACK4YQ_13815 [Phenylobacterium sp.]|uniref:hypothetical protein n=1 Tax=Phenylobacterium sp. TaxID=1871053 RepID=UPI00391A0897